MTHITILYWDFKVGDVRKVSDMLDTNKPLDDEMDRIGIDPANQIISITFIE